MFGVPAFGVRGFGLRVFHFRLAGSEIDSVFRKDSVEFRKALISGFGSRRVPASGSPL